MRHRRVISIFVVLACVAGALFGGGSAQAAASFHILIGSGDGEKLVDLILPAEDGWVFGDRIGYRCAYFYLQQDGVDVARVTVEQAGGYGAKINDKYGDEQHPQTACGTDPTPLTFGEAPQPFLINSASLALGGLLSDATWASGGCAGGAPYDYLIYDELPIVKVTVESMGAPVGPCPLPSIASFSPTVGSFGTTVVLTGTDLSGVTGVAFGGVAAEDLSIDSATQITVTVPHGAATGPISVTAADGTATGPARFTVSHRATLGLRMRRSASGLVAHGSVRIPDGTKACRAGRRVIIENKVNGVWRERGSAMTHPDGSFVERVGALIGWFRARVPQRRISGGDICGAAQDSAHVHRSRGIRLSAHAAG